MSSEPQGPAPRAPQDPETATATNKRLETVSWGLFLIMFGGLALVPHGAVPQGAWLLGAGLIMLGLNAARYRRGIRTSGFTIVLGVVAVLAGLGSLARFDVPVVPVILILVGAHLILGPLVERRRP